MGEITTEIFPSYRADGVIPARSGFFVDDDPNTKIHRFRDRILAGDAVLYTGNRQGMHSYGGDYVTEKGASYLMKNSQFAFLSSEKGRYALLAAAQGGGMASAQLSSTKMA